MTSNCIPEGKGPWITLSRQFEYLAKTLEYDIGLMKKGKIVKSDGIALPNEKVIKSLKKGKSYKYLVVLEADEVMINEIKDKVKIEYYRRVRKVLETKLNSGDIFKVINTWTVSVVRYSLAFLGWSRHQLEDIDRRTRKLLTMRNGFHPKGNVDRLYLSRSAGSRGLIGVQDTVETAILGLRDFVRNSKERLLIATGTIEHDEDTETSNESSIQLGVIGTFWSIRTFLVKNCA